MNVANEMTVGLRFIKMSKQEKRNSNYRMEIYLLAESRNANVERRPERVSSLLFFPEKEGEI